MENLKITLAFILAFSCLCVFSVFGRTSALSASVEANGITETKISDSSTEKDDTEENEEATVTVNVNFGGDIKNLDVNEYLVCVLAGEVSPDYREEALKAQAVAARTYLYYKEKHGGCANGGDICVFASHCQAYKTREQMQESWGEKFDEYYSRLESAVKSTENEIITYDDTPICALYHSSSVGVTENCYDVFGGNYPYLVSVSTPLNEGDGEYSSKASFTKSEIAQALNISFCDNDRITVTSRTDAGRVKTLKIGSSEIKATVLRAALSLRSTDFTISESGDNVIFTCLGYGHGVGMSQHGANIMAENGSSYKDILTHYYSGTEITAVSTK